MVDVRARYKIRQRYGELSIMNPLAKKRFAFRPSVTEARLEERLVLSGGARVAAIAPAPAPPPFQTFIHLSSSQTASEVQLRMAYISQFQSALTQLRTAVNRDVGLLYLNGTVPTFQQLTNLNANVR